VSRLRVSRGGPALDAVGGLARRLEPLLVRRLGELVLAVERSEPEAWAPVCETLAAIEALSTLASPERRGAFLTARELARRLGVTPKSLRRMVAEGRLAPAVRAGRFLRFRGDEQPSGRGQRPVRLEKGGLAR